MRQLHFTDENLINNLTKHNSKYPQAVFQYRNLFFQSVYSIPEVSFRGLGEKETKNIYSKPIKHVYERKRLVSTSVKCNRHKQ